MPRESRGESSGKSLRWNARFQGNAKPSERPEPHQATLLFRGNPANAAHKRIGQKSRGDRYQAESELESSAKLVSTPRPPESYWRRAGDRSECKLRGDHS